MLSFQGGPKSGDGGVWEEIPGGWAGRWAHLGKDTQEKHLFCLWRNITSPQIERYILQEYVTEERLEVPVEFDEGINNLLKKIEVVANSSSKAKWKMYVAGKKTEKD